MDEDKKRIRGACLWFRNGWGFIEDAQGNQFFAHYSEIQESGFRTLSENQLVSFISGENEKGKIAINIIPE